MNEDQNIIRVPKEWKHVKMGEVFTIERGGSPRPIDQFITQDNNGINWIKIGDTKGVVKYILQTKEKIKLAGASRSRMVYEGDFILSNSMSFRKPYIMKTTGCIHDGWLVIRKNQDIDNNFLCYILSSPVVYQQFTRLAKGSTVKNLNIEAVKLVELGIPAKDIQQQIVLKIEELFSEVDKGIEEIRTAQQQLKVYRQAVLKSAFEGKLTNKDVSEGELPKVWKWVKIEHLLSDKKKGMATGPFGTMLKKHEHQKEGIAVLGIENIGEGVFKMPNKIFVSNDKAKELKNFKVKENDIIISRSGTVGEICLVPSNMIGSIISTNLIKVSLETNVINPKYFVYLFQGGHVRQQVFTLCKGSSRAFLNQTILSSLDFPYCSPEEQQQIVQEIESRLSVCDKIEETITNSLKQAEALRQSILKKAFEGKLIKEEVPIHKLKSVYFYQTQTLGFISYYSSKHNIEHGEMTIAKFAYLLDNVYKIPTYYTYERWHLGPYPPEMKKAIKNKKFFKQTDNKIDVADVDELLKYNNPNKKKIASAIGELAEIFSGYSRKDRSHKTELLATVCKVDEDIQSVELSAVRQSMKEWLIDLPTTKFKNKAEKFTEAETANCLKFIEDKGWDKKVIR